MFRFSDFLDLAWEHALSIGVGGLGSPLEYRELMKAHMQYDEERTVDQVLAEQKARHEGHSGAKRSTTSSVTPVSALPQREVNKVKELMAQAASMRAEAETK